MRSGLLIIAVLALAVSAMAQERKVSEAEVNHAKQVADSTAHTTECTKSCLEAARLLAEFSDQYYTDGNVELGLKTMQSAADYANKAGQASIQARKHQKNTEIGLRKLEKRIDEIRQSLNVEDRPPIEEIVKQIDKLRSDILLSLFGSPKKELGPEEKK